MRIYIAGKVSGLERQVYVHNFARAEKALRRAGFKPINPVRLCKPHWSWTRCMAVCLFYVVFCSQGIYRLPDWQQSRGARIEYRVARLLGKKIMG